jgi:hypothetical protein
MVLNISPNLAQLDRKIITSFAIFKPIFVRTRSTADYNCKRASSQAHQFLREVWSSSRAKQNFEETSI